MKYISVSKYGEEIFKVAVADNYFLRLRGLIGRNVEKTGGLLIKPCNQVHCCFMRETIDVIYLAKDGAVIKIDEAMKPWSFGKMVRGAGQVLELPEGKAKLLGIREGTNLKFAKISG